jgi:hypothetical protein
MSVVMAHASHRLTPWLMRRLAIAAGAFSLAFGPCLSLPAKAEAQTVSSLHVQLRPDRPGALATLTVSIHYEDSQAAVPAPLRQAIFKLPEALGIEIPKLRSCNASKLRAHGPRACPPQSRLGAGSALVEVHAGSQMLFEHVSLGVFLGPLVGVEPTFALYAQGFTPFERIVVLRGSAVPDTPPYGEDLEVTVPPIPTLPLEPDASIASLSLSLGPRGRVHRGSTNAVIVPAHCPSGGLPFAVQSSFADGSTTTASTSLPCT